MMTTHKDIEVKAGIPITIDANTSREDRIRYENASVIYPKDEIEHALKDMAEGIEAHYRSIGQRPTIVVVLRGGQKTAAGLTKYFTPEFKEACVFDSVHASCYRDGETIGEFNYKKKLDNPPKDAYLLFVDDLIDTATTLTRLVNDAVEAEAADVKTAVLLNKQIPRKESNLQVPDFGGLLVQAGLWLYGFGMNRGFDGETEKDEAISRDVDMVLVAHGQPTLTAVWNMAWQVIPRPPRLNFVLDAAANQRAQDNSAQQQAGQPSFQG
jgi:hypoxanthine phosphoribosyltransferase